MTDFDKLPDEDLCVLANSGDENAFKVTVAMAARDAEKFLLENEK